MTASQRGKQNETVNLTANMNTFGCFVYNSTSTLNFNYTYSIVDRKPSSLRWALASMASIGLTLKQVKTNHETCVHSFTCTQTCYLEWAVPHSCFWIVHEERDHWQTSRKWMQTSVTLTSPILSILLRFSHSHPLPLYSHAYLCYHWHMGSLRKRMIDKCAALTSTQTCTRSRNNMHTCSQIDGV